MLCFGETMLAAQLSFIPGLHPPPPPSLVCRNKRTSFFTIVSSSSSNNGDSSDNDSNVRPPPRFVLRVPNQTLARSAVTLFGLGFIDAGYSGDWSRIGVISQDTEELLRIAAFVIVPLCLQLLFSIHTESE